MKKRAAKPKEPKLTEDEEIVREARERFARALEWEGTARTRFSEDVRFNAGDSDNCYQWPDAIRTERDGSRRPMLTINKTRQHCLAITNDAKQNKPSVKVKPVGDTATYKGAQVMEGIVRHIEFRSNAQATYDSACGTQVAGGVGYWRVLTEYCAPDSFDQELVIRRIRDPLSVLLDPDAMEVDKSDMRFGFIFEDLPNDRFEFEFPDLKDQVGTSSIVADESWHGKDHTRVCEYYRIKPRKRTLLALKVPETGEEMVRFADEIEPELRKLIAADETTRSREVTENTVEWFKLVGDQVAERGVWAGTTIPIVQIVGEEFVIDGKMDRKGHVRDLKDPQRMYNFWTSGATESVALQSKTPFIGSVRAIEGHETYWETANTENHSILPYNDVDDAGKPLQAPQRQQPPVMPQAYMQGMATAAEEMRMASGQYQADMGAPSNERSGKAIDARQRQGDRATYHFIDNLAIGVRYTGRILVEMIPKIYDTRRTLKILGEDGTESAVLIDPKAKAEYQEQQQAEDKVQVIFNPDFAKYSVVADVGPAYATRRQEAFNAFTQIMVGNPELMKVAGDLMFRAADFPMAEELAERLKNLVPPEALGKAPDPRLAELLQQNQNLQQNAQVMLQQYLEERTKRVAAEKDRTIEATTATTEAANDQRQTQIDAYKAETERLKTLLAQFDPRQIAQMTAQLVLEMFKTGGLPALQ